MSCSHARIIRGRFTSQRREGLSNATIDIILIKGHVKLARWWHRIVKLDFEIVYRP